LHKKGLLEHDHSEKQWRAVDKGKIINTIRVEIKRRYTMGRIGLHMSKKYLLSLSMKLTNSSKLQAETIINWMLEEGYIYDNLHTYGWINVHYDPTRQYTHFNDCVPVGSIQESNAICALAWLGM